MNTYAQATLHPAEPSYPRLEDLPPATLSEARASRDALAGLLRRERAAAADFLVALADFDRARGWERLGHASLFAFLTRELALSNGAAFLRLTAARLLARHPAVEAALREGRLCLSAVGELARVLTTENEGEVLPRFFGRSSREAKEVAAALAPRQDPPRRAVVTLVEPARVCAAPLDGSPMQEVVRPADSTTGAPEARSAPPASPPLTPPPAPLRAHEVAATHPEEGGSATGRDPGRAATETTVEPLTADLRRLHVTVTAAFLAKVASARDGLSHALPGATTEQVLEAALDLLLEKQARAKALVKRPREARRAAKEQREATRAEAAQPKASSCSSPPPGAEPAPTRHIPAGIEREVRLRDGDRCQHPLDAGGTCGSTFQVQLDHIVPRALGGPTTAANLRCTCAFHNRLAAEQALGPAVAGNRRGAG